AMNAPSMGCAPSSGASAGVYAPSTSQVRAPRLKLNWRESLHSARHWEIDLREYTSPVYVPNTDEILAGSSTGRIVKARAGSGEVVWSSRLEGGIHANPVISAGRAYVGTMAGHFYSLNMTTGEVDWSIQMRGSLETTAAVDGGRVFLTDSQDILYALDAATGEILWQHQRRSPEFFTIKGGGTPVVDGNLVYSGFSDGRLAAIFVDSGEEAWVADLSADRRELVDVDLAILIDGDRIYAASYAGGMYALERQDGLILWRRPIESIADFTISGAQIFVASAVGRVHALDMNTGEQRWQFRFQEDVPVQISATGPYLFISTAAGPLFIMDRWNGRPLSKWRPSPGFNSPVVFGGNRGYIISNGGYLYAFQLAY
ncbi:MAG: PQQ-binding-like beta-propeller repeat protein, partial [Bradymonadaceae bacterium]